MRAIAVLAVVAFHAFPISAHGGYVGVDVFFVISGYLISTILYESLRTSSFTIGEFYAKRINRIFPALVVVLVACLLAGRFLLSTAEFALLGKHVAGGSGFVSNLLLWGESGYFDGSAEGKPLLHLWSLGIEEQFYIFWPLLLWATWKRNVNLLATTAVIALASFALNVYGVGHDRVATFYSPLTRYWELLAGALLAWHDTHRPAAASASAATWRVELQSAAGLAAIAAGIGIATQDSAFPGWLALLPVLGAVAVIGAGSRAWINRVVLSNRIAVWFGLISFPLYLWHWPLLAFCHLLDVQTFHPTHYRAIRIGLVALSVLLAWATYRGIERPLRSGGRTRAKTTALVVAMLALFAVGMAIWRTDGHVFGKTPTRFEALNARQLEWNDSANAACRQETGLQSQFCMLYGAPRDVSVAVLGDSTANHLAPGLAKRLAGPHDTLIALGEGTCPPIRGLRETALWGGDGSFLAPGCLKTIEREYDYVLGHPAIRTVVLGFFAHDIANWGLPGAEGQDDAQRVATAMALLDKDIADLQRHGKQVVVTYDSPLLTLGVDGCLRPTIDGEALCRGMAAFRPVEPYVALIDAHFRGRTDVAVFHQLPIFAGIRGVPFDALDDQGILLLRDNHHLSYQGSDAAARAFVAQTGGLGMPAR